MEEWSICKDGSNSLDDVEIVQTLKSNNSCRFDLDLPVEVCGFDDSKERLRSLFDQVLSVFLKEGSGDKGFYPIPALLGNGRVVDLFKLFWVVRKNGGYESVTKNELWGFVVEECGLSVGVLASVKVVYIKYLSELDKWLRRVSRDRSYGNGECGIVEKLDTFSLDLEAKFRGLLLVEQEKKIDSVLVELESNKNGNDIVFYHSESELDLSSIGNINKVYGGTERIVDYDDDDDNKKFCTQEEEDIMLSAKRVIAKAINKVHDISERIIDDKGKKCCVQDDNNDVMISTKSVIEKVINKVHDFSERTIINTNDENLCTQDNNNVVMSGKSVVENVINKVHDISQRTFDDDDENFSSQDVYGIGESAKSVVDKVFSSRKRKRPTPSLSEMLKWVIQVAKRSDDPTIGTIPECSRWKEHSSEEIWFQALLARKALLKNRHTDSSSEETLLQKRLRMCPSMYEDRDVSNVQFTEKLRGSKRLPSLKSHMCPCCNSCSATQNNVASHHIAEVESNPKETVPLTGEILPTKTTGDLSGDEPNQRHVCVGPLFQAEVPEWTGIALESDSKWLGIQMWPQEDGKKKSYIEFDPVGKGKQNSCYCQLPGSTECVRFHIAEKRVKLKVELGSLFYHWRFNRMGEEVSLSWAPEEEKRFKHLVRQYCDTPKKLWNSPCRFFPTKTREKLVIYYFNVFVVRRRHYQNRVTPKDIDSDDDEMEFGYVGDSFGQEAIRVSGSKLLVCTQNTQSTDLE